MTDEQRIAFDALCNAMVACAACGIELTEQLLTEAVAVYAAAKCSNNQTSE